MPTHQHQCANESKYHSSEAMPVAASAASRLAREREIIATRAPSAANACTQASPIPLLAPCLLYTSDAADE
mgnify:CR=1 FL=1